MVDRIEQQFGDYHLVKLIGEGGFGKVHLGRHLHSDTEVAIKILDTQLISREQEDFLQEARVIAALKHPSIVCLLDCGIEEGKPFLTMNYASNGTLRQRHPKGNRVPLQEVITYVKPVASALSYAHKHRLIHRDIKPENMLLDSHDEVLLGDFGIALISSSSTSQSTKTAAGTVSYMAPEQILGKPDIASDQYALGIVVYEWLCGTLPFHGSFAEVGQQHLFAPPPSFEEQGVEIAPSVETVVRKALAKKPEERFADVQDFALALEESSSHSKTAPVSVLLLPRTEDDQLIPVGDVKQWREELLTKKRTTEPIIPVIPTFPGTPHIPPHRSAMRRNMIGALCLLLLMVVAVTSVVRYSPLFANGQTAPLPVVQARPTLHPTVAQTEASTTAQTEAPAVIPTVAQTEASTTAQTEVPAVTPTVAQTEAPAVIPTVAQTEASTTAQTEAPAVIPTVAQTEASTTAQTEVPAVTPTVAQTEVPAVIPTIAQNEVPAVIPTVASTTGHGLTVGPTSFSLSGCKTDAGGNWECRVLLTSDPDNQNTISWSATINGGAGVTLSQQSYQTGAILNQESGQLTPGEPVWIMITVPKSNCPATGSGSIRFTGPANVTTTMWSCS